MTLKLPPGRYAPLYHLMDVHKALAVFGEDAMPARATHFDVLSGELVQGNSFSRNKAMAVRTHDCVQLTVDQDALRRRHRLVPFDSDAAYERYARFVGEDGQVDWDEFLDYWNAYDLDPRERDRLKSAWEHQWSEEFVLGDIRPLHKYVAKIDVLYQNHRQWKTMESAARSFAREHGIAYEAQEPPVLVPVVDRTSQTAFEPLDIPVIPRLPGF